MLFAITCHGWYKIKINVESMFYLYMKTNILVPHQNLSTGTLGSVAFSTYRMIIYREHIYAGHTTTYSAIIKHQCPTACS